jgi:hypothetical protein
MTSAKYAAKLIFVNPPICLNCNEILNEHCKLSFQLPTNYRYAKFAVNARPIVRVL